MRAVTGAAVANDEAAGRDSAQRARDQLVQLGMKHVIGCQELIALHRVKGCKEKAE